MKPDMLARRAFLKLSAIGGAMALGPDLLRGQQQDSLSGRGETGSLRDPYSVGRPQERVDAADNDEVIKSIEHQLRCSCGCSLDIFTCRTTDFSCSFSPRLHRQVVALNKSGMNPEQIVQRFVDEYGERALMAPRPEGFNLAGYLVPGAVILVAASLLGAYLLRRRKVGAAEGPDGSVAAPASALPVAGTSEELARLHRALARDEDL